MNFYKHHIGDYDQATRHLSFVEDAAYSRLIRKYYAEEKPLPADIKQVQRLVGAREKAEKEAVATVLDEFFVLQDDGWHNKRCDEEVAQANKQAEANRLIALEREAKKRARKEQEESTNRGGKQHESWLGSEGVGAGNREDSDAASIVSANNFPKSDSLGSPANPHKHSNSEHESWFSREPSQTPDTRHQTPDLKPTATSSLIADPASVPSGTLSAVAVSSMLIGWERDRGKIARGVSASNAQVMDLAAMHPTADELRKAYDLAVADRQATGDANPVNAGFVLALLGKVRNPPKPCPKSLAQMTDIELEAEAQRIGAHTHGYSRDQAIASIQAKRKQLEGAAA